MSVKGQQVTPLRNIIFCSVFFNSFLVFCSCMLRVDPDIYIFFLFYLKIFFGVNIFSLLSLTERTLFNVLCLSFLHWFKISLFKFCLFACLCLVTTFNPQQKRISQEISCHLNSIGATNMHVHENQYISIFIVDAKFHIFNIRTNLKLSIRYCF